MQWLTSSNTPLWPIHTIFFDKSFSDKEKLHRKNECVSFFYDILLKYVDRLLANCLDSDQSAPRITDRSKYIYTYLVWLGS